MKRRFSACCKLKTSCMVLGNWALAASVGTLFMVAREFPRIPEDWAHYETSRAFMISKYLLIVSACVLAIVSPCLIWGSYTGRKSYLRFYLIGAVCSLGISAVALLASIKVTAWYVSILAFMGCLFSLYGLFTVFTYYKSIGTEDAVRMQQLAG